MKLRAIFKTMLALGVVLMTSLLIAFFAQKRTSPNPIEITDLIPKKRLFEDSTNLPFYSTIGDKDPSDQAPNTMRFEKYTVELKRFTRQQQAEALIDKLAMKNIDAYFTPVMSDDRVYYIVRTGIFSDENTAKQHAEKMRVAQKVNSTVVRLQ